MQKKQKSEVDLIEQATEKLARLFILHIDEIYNNLENKEPDGTN